MSLSLKPFISGDVGNVSSGIWRGLALRVYPAVWRPGNHMSSMALEERRFLEVSYDKDSVISRSC